MQQSQQSLTWDERLHHRDQLRDARYAALADAEGFPIICFALEALGVRLLRCKGDLGKYQIELAKLAKESEVLIHIAPTNPAYFSSFNSLFDLVNTARNDAMHTGVYARHATAAAIDLCIALEEALMTEQQNPRTQVSDFMVKSPVTIEKWQLVAYARQLMLTHSFSYLPVFYEGKWKILSEISLAKFLRSDGIWKEKIALPIDLAINQGLKLYDAIVVSPSDLISGLIDNDDIYATKAFWLVRDADRQDRLCGVLTPFELM